MEAIMHIGLGFLLSMIGSIPLGLITLTLVDITARKGFQAGVAFSFGATIIEFFYTVVALCFIEVFMEYPKIDTIINWVAVFVFFGFSFYYLFTPAKTSITESVDKAHRRIQSNSSFFFGLGIASLNMLILPFWIFLGGWLNNLDYLRLDFFWILIFSLGAALGALVVFLGYAKLSFLIIVKADKVSDLTNKVIGGVFMALALYQLWKIGNNSIAN